MGSYWNLLLLQPTYSTTTSPSWKDICWFHNYRFIWRRGLNAEAFISRGPQQQPGGAGCDLPQTSGLALFHARLPDSQSGVGRPHLYAQQIVEDLVCNTHTIFDTDTPLLKLHCCVSSPRFQPFMSCILLLALPGRRYEEWPQLWFLFNARIESVKPVTIFTAVINAVCVENCFPKQSLNSKLLFD